MKHVTMLSAIAVALGAIAIATTPADAAKKKAVRAAPAGAVQVATAAGPKKSEFCKVIVPDQLMVQQRNYYGCW
jgi:hypothetical protein